jgi:hypothetical protein
MANAILKVTKGTGTLPSIIDGQLVFNTATQKLYLDSGTTRYLMGGAQTETPSSLTIKLNGTSQGAWNGASAKTIDITPANIGAAPTSHASTATTYGAASASNYGHAMASSTTPKANGTAAVGSETAKFARGDHVHPLQTSVSGSAGSVAWGNVSGKPTSFPPDSHTHSYLPLSGGTVSGNINFQTIASWPTATGETYPINSAGLYWNGSSDTAKIFYRVTASDSGHLII